MQNGSHRKRRRYLEPDAHRAQFLWTFFVCLLVAATALYNATQSQRSQSSLFQETPGLSEQSVSTATTGQLAPLSKIRSTASEGK